MATEDDPWQYDVSDISEAEKVQMTFRSNQQQSTEDEADADARWWQDAKKVERILRRLTGLGRFVVGNVLRNRHNDGSGMAVLTDK
ncbi:hypothetical protein Aduo_006763 [Ancylostoma duodenale]